jgi:hypothetical protein
VASYLTIPEITEAEDMLSMTAGDDGLTFHVTINAGDTAARLMVAFDRSERLPLVVLATDGGMVALDDVYVTGVSFTSDPTTPIASVSFLARDVRFT